MSLVALLRLAQRYISRRVLQSVLFILGVALGVAMMVAIDLANVSSNRAFELSTQTITGRATHQINGASEGLPTEVYRQLRIDLGLRALAPIQEGYIRALELGDQPMRMLGVDPFAEPPFRDYLTTVQVGGIAGNAFEGLNAFLAEPNTVLMSATTAAKFGIAAGDTLTLRPAEGRITVRVVGLLQTDDAISGQALETLLLTDISTAQDILGSPGLISRIDLILPDDYDTSQITALLPAGAVLQTTASQNAALSQMTAAFSLNLQALSLLALVVGVFLIYNTVTFTVVQRRPVLGTLRALGATRGQIFTLILGEALLLGAFGTLLGLALGIIFGRAVVGVIAQTISDLYFSVNVQGVTVEPFTLLKGAAVGIFASVGAALVPSIDATRTPPAGSMRRSLVEEKTQRLILPITIAAVALNAMGVILLLLPTQSLVISFTALFSIVVGGALFTPLLLVVAMRWVTPGMGRLFGIVGRMAPRAVSRALSRTSVAVAALTVAVSVIVGVTVMIDSFRGTVSDWLNTTLGADIYISPPSLTATRATANIDPEYADRLSAIEGVERVVVGRNVDVVAPDYPDLPPAYLNIADGEVVASDRRFVWKTAPDDYWSALYDGQIMVSEPFAFRRNITPENNTLRLLTDQGEQTFTIAGVYYDYSTDQGSVVMAQNVYRQFYDDPYISTMAVFLASDADSAPVIDAARDALRETELTVQSNRALRDNVFEVFERTFSITGALQLLSVLVAFVGILSALMALQLEQTRQYGVMRAIGMTGGQLWRYTLIQTGLMGAAAGALALPIGVALAYILIYVINVRSFGWTMQLALTPNEFLLAFGVAVLAALAAGIYPARRLTQLVVGKALRQE